MTETSDTLKSINLETWNATDTSVLSYIKTPIQNTFFTNNSGSIGKALRQSILYFADTLNTIDRPSCALGNEFRTTRTHKYQVLCTTNEKNAQTTTSMEITTYAPIGFEHLRSIIGITRADFYSSFKNGELLNFTNTGRSGSQMYKTQDDIYIIKTLRDHEAKLLIQALPGLYLRYSHTTSLLTRYVGLYSVNMRSIISSEIYCVIMLNNLPSIVDIHEIYDLKGSSVGRYASIDLPLKRLRALKDLDLESFYPHGIRIPHEIYRRLKLTLENDIFELRKIMITDFSLMLGVHHLDEYSDDQENNEDDFKKFKPKPQLGISSFLAAFNVNEEAIKSNEIEENKKLSDEKMIEKFLMKPLHLIACNHENTFNDNHMASSLLGIPGVTHDGRRVLLYPAFIDCLQSFDNFKRMQHAIQSIRDPEQSSEYSVIPPNEYEKRLIRFLFNKVFIDSNQTLDKLLESPVISTIYPQHNIEEEEEENSNLPEESFEFLQMPNNERFLINSEQILQTPEVIQKITLQPFTPTETDKISLTN